MSSDKLSLLVGIRVATDFETLCGAVLAEAAERAHNPIDGAGVRICPEERLRFAAGNLLMTSGLLQEEQLTPPTHERLFTITELGWQAYARLMEKVWETVP